jgi:hypothetical protein
LNSDGRSTCTWHLGNQHHVLGPWPLALPTSARSRKRQQHTGRPAWRWRGLHSYAVLRVAWKCLGVAKRNEMPSQGNMVDCGLFTCKAPVENLVADCLPLVGSGDGSRRGGFSAGPNANMNRRRLIVLIGQDTRRRLGGNASCCAAGRTSTGSREQRATRDPPSNPPPSRRGLRPCKNNNKRKEEEEARSYKQSASR